MSGDLNCVESQKLNTILEDIGEVERMLKALIKSLERKVSSPG